MDHTSDLMQWLHRQVVDVPERGVAELVLRVVNRFEEERRRQGLTKTELARRAGLNRAHLSRLLAEPSNVTMGTLMSIANALGMTLEVKASRGAQRRKAASPVATVDAHTPAMYP